MVSGAALALEKVSFAYAELPVLQGLDVRIEAGERVALLGPNGSGKSTLLDLAGGLRKPRGGRVLLDGSDLAAIPAPERARRIATVAQTPTVPLTFTVRELVSLGRTPYVTPFRGEREADRAIVNLAMEQAEVAHLSERLVGEVSGGERQRATLALALAQEPSLLLLDEATAHLDLHHQMSILGLVRTLSLQQGMTVLAAVHDLNLAALWFDRLLLLHEGRIAADGSPEEVLRPDLISEVYRSRVRILPHPAEDVPIVVPEREA